MLVVFSHMSFQRWYSAPGENFSSVNYRVKISSLAYHTGGETDLRFYLRYTIQNFSYTVQ